MPAIKHHETLRNDDYFKGGALPCVVREMHNAPSNAFVAMHGHEFSELVIVASGSLSHIHAEGTDRLHAGDFFVIHPGEQHGYANLTNKTVVFNLLYHCSRAPVALSMAGLPTLPLFFPKEPSGCRARTIGRIPKRELPHIVNLVREIRREEDARRPLGAAVSASLFAALLMRLFCATAEAAAATAESPIQAEIDYIAQHLAEKITFKELCAVSGKSISTLSREFKKSTKHSPGDYILNLRVEKAQALLSQPKKLPLAEIASLTGFCNSSHLSRALSAHGYSATSRARKKPGRSRSRADPD